MTLFFAHLGQHPEDTEVTYDENGKIIEQSHSQNDNSSNGLYANPIFVGISFVVLFAIIFLVIKKFLPEE